MTYEEIKASAAVNLTNFQNAMNAIDPKIKEAEDVIAFVLNELSKHAELFEEPWELVIAQRGKTYRIDIGRMNGKAYFKIGNRWLDEVSPDKKLILADMVINITNKIAEEARKLLDYPISHLVTEPTEPVSVKKGFWKR